MGARLRAARPPAGGDILTARAPAVTVLPTPEDLYRTAARRIGQVISLRGVCAVALAGGTTPRPVYELLAEASLDWSRVQVFFTDERAVPPDHRDSNYRMVRTALLDRVPIPREQVYRIRGELSPGDAARAYAAELPPFLDLAVLGMGADGHTASLFPDTDVLAERDRAVREVFVHAQGAWRITLTLPYLTRARSTILLVAGRAKAQMVARVLSLTAPDPALPVSLLHTGAADPEWLLDADAASMWRGRL